MTLYFSSPSLCQMLSDHFLSKSHHGAVLDSVSQKERGGKKCQVWSLYLRSPPLRREGSYTINDCFQ